MKVPSPEDVGGPLDDDAAEGGHKEKQTEQDDDPATRAALNALREEFDNSANLSVCCCLTRC